MVDHFGCLDVVVYCAGMMHAASSLRTPDSDWSRVLSVNLTGAFVAAREAATHMMAHGGRMTLFGTAFVGRVLPLTIAYNFSKGGLHQVAHSLAAEWAHYAITVNGIASGYFDTEMPQSVLGDPQLRDRVLDRILHGLLARTV